MVDFVARLSNCPDASTGAPEGSLTSTRTSPKGACPRSSMAGKIANAQHIAT